MHRITVALAGLLLAAPLSAQDAAPDSTPRNSLQKGAWSLSFDAPAFGGGDPSSLGGWKMVGERTNLGVSVGIHTRNTESRSDSSGRDEITTGLMLGVEARRYVSPAREITPFATGGVFAFLSRFKQDYGAGEGEQHVYGAGVSAGAGVEWFPVRRISLAGHTGVRLNVHRGESSTDHGGGQRRGEERGWDLSTFTTALSLQIYF
jgi:hypothetical protein